MEKSRIICNTIDSRSVAFILESPLEIGDDYKVVTKYMDRISALYSRMTMRLITTRIYFDYAEGDVEHAKKIGRR